jgi:hypothetical protein
VLSKSKIFKFLKRDCGTIPVAEIINGKIEIFSKHQRFLIATESSKYLLIFVLYVCVILCEFGTAISKRYACFCCLFKIIILFLLHFFDSYQDHAHKSVPFKRMLSYLVRVFASS